MTDYLYPDSPVYSRRQFDAVAEAYLLGLPTQRVAEVTGVNVGTVKGFLRRNGLARGCSELRTRRPSAPRPQAPARRPRETVTLAPRSPEEAAYMARCDAEAVRLHEWATRLDARGCAASAAVYRALAAEYEREARIGYRPYGTGYADDRSPQLALDFAGGRC